MPTLLEYYDYAKLALAAYVRLESVDTADGSAVAQAANTQARIPSLLADNTFNSLGNSDPVWTIPRRNIQTASGNETATGYLGNDGSGFAATLFERDGQKVLAIRGTEPTGDQSFPDLVVADLGQIGFVGFALSQTVSMINFILRLRAPSSTSSVVQFRWEASLTKPATLPSISVGHGAAYVYLVPSYTGQGLGLIGETETFSVTGHSLGGHLAAMAARLFPGQIDQAYLFNAPGFDPATANVLTVLPGMELVRAAISNFTLKLTEPFISLITPWLPSRPAESFSELTLYNIESEDLAPGNDLSIVSSVITGSSVLGTETFITTEGNSHLIEPLMDSLALQALLYSMNSSLTEANITRLYEAISNNSFNTQERLVETLYKLFTLDPVNLILVDSEKDDPLSGALKIGAGNIAGRRDFYEKLITLQEKVRANPAVTLSSLADLSVDELVIRSSALNGIAYRYALHELNPFAILGPDVLYVPHNANGQLNQYDSSSAFPTGMTNSYIFDRAQFLFWKMQVNTVDAPNVTFSSNSQTFSFEDQAQNIGILVKRLGATTSPTPLQISKVIFGADSDTSPLLGGVNTDHLYGGGGDDRLDGNAGDDYLEGNGGDDILIGGPGDDELLGGTGFDSYVYDSGDGFDTIVDDDGSGEIVYMGGALTGGAKVGEGVYESESGVEFIYLDFGTGSGTLWIDGLIHIENFSPGVLGLQFDEEEGLPNEPGELPSNVYDGHDLPRDLNSGEIGDLLRFGHGSMGDDLFLVTDQMSGVFGRSGNDVAILDDSAYGLDIDMGAGDDYIDAIASLGSIEAARLSGGAGNDVIYAGSGNDIIWGDSYVAILRPYRGTSLLIVDGFTYNAGTQAGSGLLSDLAAGQGAFAVPFGDLSSVYGYGPSDFGTLVSDGTFFTGTLQEALENVLGTEGSFDDFIDAGSGDDFVVGGSGADRIFGGDGNDSIWGDYGGGSLDAPTYQRLETLFGSSAALFGRPGDDYVDGGAGNDVVIDRDGGNDILIGGQGNDTILSAETAWTTAEGEGAHNVIDGGAGDDVITVYNATGGFDVVEGGDGDDNILVNVSRYTIDEDDDGVADGFGPTDGRAFVYGGSGNDVLTVQADDGVVDGGPGNDVYAVSGNSIVISDMSGDDTLQTIFLFDHASFDAYLESAVGGDGTEPEDQTLILVVARDGNDLVARKQSASEGAVIESSEFVFKDWFSGSNFQIEHIGVSDGFGGDAMLTAAQFEVWGGYSSGSGGADQLLEFSEYADLSFGRAGNDWIATGAGNDRIYGGTGDDELYGGSGDDSYSYAVGDGNDLVYDSSGFDEIRVGPGISVADVSAAIGEAGIVLTVGAGNIGIVGGSRSDPGVEQIRFSDGSTVLVSSLLPVEVAASGPEPEGEASIVPGEGVGVSAEAATGSETASGNVAQVSSPRLALVADTVEIAVAQESSLWLPDIKLRDDLNLKIDDAATRLLSRGDQTGGSRYAYGDTALDLQAMLDAMEAFDMAGGHLPAIGAVDGIPTASETSALDEDLRPGSALTSLALANALLQFHLEQSDAYGVSDGASDWFRPGDALAGIGVNSGMSAFGSAVFSRQAQSLATFAGLQEGFVRLT